MIAKHAAPGLHGRLSTLSECPRASVFECKPPIPHLALCGVYSSEVPNSRSASTQGLKVGDLPVCYGPHQLPHGLPLLRRVAHLPDPARSRRAASARGARSEVIRVALPRLMLVVEVVEEPWAFVAIRSMGRGRSGCCNRMPPHGCSLPLTRGCLPANGVGHCC